MRTMKNIDWNWIAYLVFLVFVIWSVNCTGQ
uniref:Uncharacterized protein n=1 Tax=Phage sp. ct17O1 TaxID=2825789 RepID=A0A8S5PJX4_9VIRU|nr:MAG TPA: hypothetical protein [Phage sp. ct17O1]